MIIALPFRLTVYTKTYIYIYIYIYIRKRLKEVLNTGFK